MEKEINLSLYVTSSYIIVTLNPNQICIVPFGTLFSRTVLNTDALSKKNLK